MAKKMKTKRYLEEGSFDREVCKGGKPIKGSLDARADWGKEKKEVSGGRFCFRERKRTKGLGLVLEKRA